MNDTNQQTYRVLARKYRPETFSELIGQDTLVRTLSNALTLGRLAHAFILTGVRGIGKTSTARLLAKGLTAMVARHLNLVASAIRVRPSPAGVMSMFWKWMQPAIQGLTMLARL
jgi:replication-associated recombination protein RarA